MTSRRCKLHRMQLSDVDSEGRLFVDAHDKPLPQCYQCMELMDPEQRRQLRRLRPRPLVADAEPVMTEEQVQDRLARSDWPGSQIRRRVDKRLAASRGSQAMKLPYRTPLGRDHPAFTPLYPLEEAFYEVPRQNRLALEDWVFRGEQAAAAGLKFKEPKPRTEPTYGWIPFLRSATDDVIAAIYGEGQDWEGALFWRADITYWMERLPKVDRLIVLLFLCGFSDREIAWGPARGRKRVKDPITLRMLNRVRRAGLTPYEVRTRLRDASELLRGASRGYWQDDLLPAEARQETRRLLQSWWPVQRGTTRLRDQVRNGWRESAVNVPADVEGEAPWLNASGMDGSGSRIRSANGSSERAIPPEPGGLSPFSPTSVDMSTSTATSADAKSSASTITTTRSVTPTPISRTTRSASWAERSPESTLSDRI